MRHEVYEVDPHTDGESYGEALQHHLHAMTIITHGEQHKPDEDAVVNGIADVVDIHDCQAYEDKEVEEIKKEFAL